MSKKQKNLAILASVFLMLLTIAPVSNAMQIRCIRNAHHGGIPSSKILYLMGSNLRTILSNRFHEY